MTAAPPRPTVPPGWHDTAAAVPRRDQTVRVLTRYGADHQAQFVVAFTADWPQGVWWSIQNGRVTIPFADIVAWSPDPEARPPRPAPASEPDGPRPALVGEVLAEVGKVGGLIRLIPEASADWTPHPGVASPRTLAWRLAQVVARLELVFALDAVELGLEPAAPEAGPLREADATYGANARAAAEAAARATAASLRAPWQLERGGVAVATMPRGNAVRAFGMAPLVYHRGELGVLLTALGVHVPHPYPLWSFGGPGGEAAPLD
ncbi:hypothetical protein [Rubrivirga litoralis]|uniref:DinB superfamily protein n=1 Tax=Rubrivirga litoralis TaxID=3075598 RepID=A0ABU3BUE3_9BACT|nr:hypothetical protein [Rubrivirga sp. F394]MDT0632913.1 hypothetical protein [Rubrivirga sp. F394]